MNSVELRETLVNAMYNAYENGTIKESKNMHPSYWLAVIDCIIKMYNNKPGYYEEDAIKTFEDFIKTGVLNWK